MRETEVVNDSKGTVLSRHNRADACTNSQRRDSTHKTSVKFMPDRIPAQTPHHEMRAVRPQIAYSQGQDLIWGSVFMSKRALASYLLLPHLFPAFGEPGFRLVL